jgi:hypothetical protein
MTDNLYDVELSSILEAGRLAGLEIPAWIEQDITCGTVMEICVGGCDSGAYMPAVTYYTAKETMAKHGEEIVDFIVERLGQEGLANDHDSFGAICCFFVSSAVDLWATEAYCMMQDELEEESA